MSGNRACLQGTRYDPVAIALHWAIAVLLIGLLCMGLYMTSLAFSPARLRLFNWHKWFGMTALALMIVRTLWRVRHRAPAFAAMPRWQILAAQATHGLLYMLAIAAPLAGWVYSSAAGFPVVLFGVLPLPDLVTASEPLAQTAKQWHHWLVYLLGACVLLHIAAVAKHQWLDKDHVLARMGIGTGIDKTR